MLVVGISVVGYGFYQLYNAYEADFEEHLKHGQMSNAVKGLITHGGQFGLGARGVVLSGSRAFYLSWPLCGSIRTRLDD